MSPVKKWTKCDYYRLQKHLLAIPESEWGFFAAFNKILMTKWCLYQILPKKATLSCSLTQHSRVL